MSKQHCTQEVLRAIDFGSIDGATDPNLTNYFFDDDYWGRIVIAPAFFVIGRKGTGKSAIYRWLALQALERGSLFANLEFRNFPFQRLLSLTDDGFTTPNQYQSIWRYMILAELARLAVSDQAACANEHYRQLSSYMRTVFGANLLDLHCRITEIARKTTGAVTLPKFPIAFSAEQSHSSTYDSSPYDSISAINRALEEEVISYFLSYRGSAIFAVQFDQLDDSFNAFTDRDRYFQCLISLLKVVYSLNQRFLSMHIPARVIAYLRSDIYYRIDEYDAESAKWDEYRLDTDWSIPQGSDMYASNLRKLVNLRICASLHDVGNDPWSDVFDNDIIGLKAGPRRKDAFRYVVDRSLHRPREIIQFCRKMQQAADGCGAISHRTVRMAEREYSLWLQQELANELAGDINDLRALFHLLRRIGANVISVESFNGLYADSGLKQESDSVLQVLYRRGVVVNATKIRGIVNYYSVVRNERSLLNQDLPIAVHRGLLAGLYVQQ